MINADNLEKLLTPRKHMALDLHCAQNPDFEEIYGSPERQESEARRLETLLAKVDADIDNAVSGSGATGEPQVRPPLMKWGVSRRKFGDVTYALYNAGCLIAESKADALRQACQHWMDVDGKPFHWELIKRSLEKREEEGKGPAEIPFDLSNPKD